MSSNRRKGDEMRRATAIAVLVLVILAGVAIGVGSYHAGVTHGLTEAGHATQVVRVEERGGFFPFGIFLFPLFFFGVFFLLRMAFWGRRWGGSGKGRWDSGHWESRGGRFEEWHRRQHEQGAGDHPSTGGEPASV
jgi:hypothetical protein